MAKPTDLLKGEREDERRLVGNPGHPGLRIGGVLILKAGERAPLAVVRERIARGIAAVLAKRRK